MNYGVDTGDDVFETRASVETGSSTGLFLLINLQTFYYFLVAEGYQLIMNAE